MEKRQSMRIDVETKAMKDLSNKIHQMSSGKKLKSLNDVHQNRQDMDDEYNEILLDYD